MLTESTVDLSRSRRFGGATILRTPKSIAASALLAAAVMSCSGTVEQDLSIEIDPVCLNPTIVVDGPAWLTNDTHPVSWADEGTIDGRFIQNDDNSATFVADDGTVLNYVRSSPTHHPMSCHIE
jgi:hypothetical protein